MKRTYTGLLVFLLGCMLNSCVEPYEFDTETFESALVVEATITNEVRIQEVHLSRTYSLDNNGPVAESNAEVRIVDNASNLFNFVESTPGKYISVSPFAAVEGRDYTLEINVGGRSYTSIPARISGKSEIEDLYPVTNTTSQGGPGVAILINSIGRGENSGYYRYEYIETFKIQSPFFKSMDIISNDGGVDIVPKAKEEYTCFRTENSHDIILGNSTSLSEDRLEGKMVRFLSEEDPELAHRYSILVRQYGLSREAYAFYENLKELSESESLFSQIQPGFLEGNVYSEENREEKVIGYFNVSWVEEKRVFFNYEDFYDPGGRRPSYVTYCPLDTPTTVQDLFSYIESESWRLYQDNDNFKLPYTSEPGRYIFTRAECVDCTTLGTNEKPEFWVD